MKHRIALLLTIVLYAAISSQPALSGQLQSGAGDSQLLRNYQFVKHSDPWLTSRNASGLTRYQSQDIAEAELYLTSEKGGLTDYWQSPSVLQAGTNAEAFCRVNQRTVVYGQVGYDNFSGHDMTGSAFINPTRKPFDIVEDSLVNPGTKHRDTYQLQGAVGCTVADGFAVGLRLDYTAANYAKYKDLRHKNKLMDLVFSAGASVTLIPHSMRDLPHLTIGADYFYHRQTESVTFSIYGREDKVYKSFINYGPFIGKVEQLGNSGFTDKSREMPMTDDINGVDVQLSADITPRLAFYSNVTYQHRNGYYGRKSPYTITYTRHSSDGYACQGQLTLNATQSQRHSLAFTLDVENLRNDLQNYRELRDPNDVTYYEYYDPAKTANRLWADWDITYTGHFGIRHELPAWTFTASLLNQRRKQTAYLYPFRRRQNLRHTEGVIQAGHNIVLSKGVLSVAAHFAFAKGSGEPYEDDTMSQPSDKQTSPATMEAFLYREYRYFTAPQYHLGTSVQYAFLMPGTHLNTHIRGQIDHHKANESNDYCPGNDRTRLTLAVGCTF